MKLAGLSSRTASAVAGVCRQSARMRLAPFVNHHPEDAQCGSVARLTSQTLRGFQIGRWSWVCTKRLKAPGQPLLADTSGLRSRPYGQLPSVKMNPPVAKELAHFQNPFGFGDGRNLLCANTCEIRLPQEIVERKHFFRDIRGGDVRMGSWQLFPILPFRRWAKLINFRSVATQRAVRRRNRGVK